MSTAAVSRPSAEERIRAALWFAERGFGVFSVWSADADGVCRCPLGPDCDNAGKHPIPRRGFLDATTEEARIRAMLSAGSEPNYGLVCPDGVFALDVDGEGLAHLAELETEYGPLPATLTTTTAHGRHVFLSWPDGVPRPIGQLFGFVTRWGSGRDAGYVIGPRSVHASGAVYEPANVFEIAALPDAWARAAVDQPKPGDAFITVGAGYVLPERVPASKSRYGEILAYTAHLYNRGLSVPEMWPLVKDVLAPRFDERLTERELRARFDRCTVDLGPRLGPPRIGGAAQTPAEPIDPATFPAPENRGKAALSNLGEVEYVDDLVRPGRVLVWAAEEGSGKSYAVAGELAIRIAAAGGAFAETWDVLRTGPVLVLSEMHSDDDFVREDIVLRSLGIDRGAIDERYFRLDLMTAAAGRPALTVPEWRSWCISWTREHGVLLLVIDTATGATQVDPWGREIQAVYASLRLMLADYPELAVVLIVHVKKPSGKKGEGRELSDVLGEWGRWCDVVVLQENDGQGFERTKLTTRKRVRRQRRVVATKRSGLLVDAIDLDDGSRSKVPETLVLEAIAKHPGSTFTELGRDLGIHKDTAKRYVAGLGNRVKVVAAGRRAASLVYLATDDRSTVQHGTDSAVANGESEVQHGAVRESDDPAAVEVQHRSTVQHHPDSAVNPTGSDRSRDRPPKGGVGAAVPAALSSDPGPAADEVVSVDPAPEATWVNPCYWYEDHRSAHRQVEGGWTCDACHPPGDAS